MVDDRWMLCCYVAMSLCLYDTGCDDTLKVIGLEYKMIGGCYVAMLLCLYVSMILGVMILVSLP